MSEGAKKSHGKSIVVGALALGAIVAAVVLAMFVRDTIQLRAIEADNARRARATTLEPPSSATAYAPVAKGPPPVGPSCDVVPSTGSCYEYANTRGARWQNSSSPEGVCKEANGRWSREPCSREGAVGLCVFGGAAESGTVQIMHANGYTASLEQRLAYCKTEEGAYTALP